MKGILTLFIVCLASLALYITFSRTFAKESSMNITSPDFANNQQLPLYATCKGEGVNPPLQWSGVPAQAKSLVLISDDPDAKPFNDGKTFVHWIVYDLKPDITQLPKNVRIQEMGGKEWKNSGNKSGYYPACPPRGSGPHRYYFKLYALNVEQLPLDASMSPNEVVELLDASQSKYIVAKAELIGIFEQR